MPGSSQCSPILAHLSQPDVIALTLISTDVGRSRHGVSL